MANPTRFPSGISNNVVGSVMGNYPLLDFTNVVRYSNDFMSYAAGDWTVIASGSGSTAANAGSVNGGGSMLQTWGTSGSQANTLAILPFRFLATTSLAKGNQFWFDVNAVASATALTPNYQIGVIAGTATSTTDGVYFTKAAAALTWSIVLKSAAGSTTTIALPAANVVADATRFQIGFYYDAKPQPTLWIYYNNNLVGTLVDETKGSLVGSLGTRGANNLANLPASTVGVGPSFLVGTGGTLEIDSVTCACEISR